MSLYKFILHFISVCITLTLVEWKRRPHGLNSAGINKTIILPVVLYGSETWSLTLREEHRLRVFENKVLRKIFGAMKDEITR